MSEARSHTISSFTLVKGLLVEETLLAFQAWDLTRPAQHNWTRLKEDNTVQARSENWLRQVHRGLHRRYDPDGRDRPLVELAQQDPDPVTWRAALLWHATRDEFLLRDFLLNWLYPRFEAGTLELRTADVETYLGSLAATKAWSPLTRNRVAGALLRSAAQTGLLTGHQTRRFASYHLNDEAFLYLLHALAEREPNGRRLVHSPEWRMFLMGPAEVERELLRLHQYRKLRYEAAGTLAQLQLPDQSLADHVHGRAR